jgi:hypothetical protein
MTTFLSTEEPARGDDARTLARALVGTRAPLYGRTMILETIDGVPSPESALAETLVAHGFVARQGALVHMHAPHAAITYPDHDSDEVAELDA